MLDNYDDYQNGGTHKVFSISVVGENITITNENLRTESIVLDEELCSTSKLKFGSCGTSKFTAEIANVFENFEGKLIEVTVTMDDEVTKYGTFKVVSDKPLADRIFRSLTAYDAMNDIINTNVLDWYNGLTFPITLKNFRDSFFNYLGITQETTSLINDNFSIPGGFTASDSLMGNTIITSICEFNGVFGHINRDGKFTYIDLTAAESFDCPPYENGSVTYEDFVTSPITKVTMRGSASDVGTSVGVDGNEYIIQGNPLIYGTEGKPALTTAMTNLLNKIKTVVFRPFELRKTIGNPCVEIGDAIEIETKYETVNSYVLRRTLTGIQALRDRYSALGSKVYPAEATSYQNEITRTKGKMHEFEVTLDGFSSRVAEVESDVEGLDSDLRTNYSTTTQMNSAIEQSAEGIRTEVSQTYATQQTVTNVKNSTIKSDVLHYLATSAGSGVTRSTPGWTTTIQSMTETNQYLWTYHTYTYGDDHTSDTDPIITGRYGQNGSQGPQGPTGPQGPQGSQGNPGDDGISIVEVIPLKYAGNSTTAPTAPTSNVTRTDAATGVWTRGVPALTNTYKYMYTCDQIKYSNNTYTWTSVVLDNAITNLTQRMTQAELDLQPDSITAKVSSTNTFTTLQQFNALKIGGENLFPRRGYRDALFYGNKIKDLSYDDFTYGMTATGADMYIYSVATAGSTYSTGFGPLIPIKAGESVYIKIDDMINSTNVFTKNYITLWDANKVSLGYSQWYKTNDVYTCPAAQTTAAYMSLKFGYGSAVTDTLYKARVKIERGNKPTDFSPASEDLDDNAQSYANAAETTAKSYTDAQLQITSSSILSTVEQGYTTKTEYADLAQVADIGDTNLASKDDWGKYGGGNVSPGVWSNVNIDNYTINVVGNPGDLVGVRAKNISGSYVTFSYETDLDQTTNYYRFKNANLEPIGNQSQVNVTPKNGKVTYTLAVPTGATVLDIGFGKYPYSTNYYIKNPKITNGMGTAETADIPGTNLMRYAPTKNQPSTYQPYTIPITEKIQIGQTYTIQLWDINISNSAKTADQLSVAVFAGGGRRLLAEIKGFTNGHADYKFATFTITSEYAQEDLNNLYINIYNSPPNVSGATMNLTIGRWKLEKGNRATEWQMNPIDASSKSEVEQLANMVAIKVNSSGRLVTAALGVDPASATSYVKVKADDIDIISNGNIQLTSKSIGITSTNFSVTAAGLLTCTGANVKGDIITDSLKIDNKAYLSIETATATYTSFTLSNDFAANPYGAMSSAVQSNRLLISSGYGLNIPSDVYFGKYVKMNDNALVDKDLQVNGNFLAVGNGCIGGWLRAGGNIMSDGEGVFGTGIELGMKSNYAAAFIDFHWGSTNTDWTARIVQRAESTVDLIGKNSSTWGIWRAASFSSQSSKYVKKNIKDVTEKEARNILKLRPVKFDYKNSDLTNQRGLIAEEVLEIMPEMVNVPKDYTEFNKDEPWNTPSIDYSKFVPYLIKMIQILQTEIDDLKK